ncbi:MAG: hypothetical protein AB7G06_01910 [Bdellovibrionales bacterium]
MAEQALKENTSSTDGHGPDLRARVAAVQKIITPLLMAIYEVQGSIGQTGTEATNQNIDLLGKLLDNTVTFSQQTATQLGGGTGAEHDWVRWGLATASSQCVAAHYRATGRPLPPAESDGLAAAFNEFEKRFPSLLPVGPEYGPLGLGMFRAKLLEAMTPVVGACAQYAFGRQEHALLSEVTQRLLQASEMVTRALAPPTATPDEWRILAWSVIKSAGQIYTECHYAEADRLLYMEPEERSAYFAEHGQQVPMTKVWQQFDQRMGMLTTLAAYVELPASSKLDNPEWQG